VVALSVTTAAHAAATDSETPRVEFSAQRLELDPSLATLRLSGNVRVSVERYRLSSDHLTLRTEHGTVRVGGPAELAFCGCPSPPVTLRFDGARLTKTDAIVENPTVRAFGVPVLWLPWLWFRAPSEWGLLPFELAYRGDDGLFVGSGVHAPLGRGGLDVSGGGYVEGGAEVSARLTTDRTSSFVKWDHLHDTALSVDLRGAASPDGWASLAWSADALRGPRALRGPSLLEEVALRQDRARGAAGFSDGVATVGISVEADAPRGAALTSSAVVGPALYVGFGVPLGANATANIDVGAATWARPDAASLTLLSSRAELRGTTHAGPVVLDVSGRTRALSTFDENAAGYSAATALTAELSAPFVKELGTPSLLEHWVTPFVVATAGGSETRAPSVVPAVAPDGAFLLAAAGVRSTVGERAGKRAAVSATLRAGYANDGRGRGVPLATWRVTGQAPAFAVRGEGVSSWSTGDRGSVVLSALRLGPESGVFVEGRAEGMSGEVPLLARVLASGFDAPWAPWLTGAGWTAGGRVGVPWTRAVSSDADADYDFTNHVLLGVRGGVTYRHPCGCLSATAWAGHRTARVGADGFLTVSLSP
jgi:hypothetical protein